MILVPLDGTPRSEAILDVVEALARAHHATVRLLRVAGPVDSLRAIDGSIVAFADQVTASIERQMGAYFARLEARLPGVRVEGVVRFGDAVAEIVDQAESAGADLIAMTRRSGELLGRLRRRSVSRRRVARATTIPLLVVRAGRGPARPSDQRYQEQPMTDRERTAVGG